MFSIQELAINIDQEDTEPGLAALALLGSLRSCCWQAGSHRLTRITCSGILRAFTVPECTAFQEGLGGADSVSE